MKAAYIYKLNKPLKISNTIKPEELNYGQLLIKNYYTGVCKSQIYEIYGGRDNKKYIPHLLGHEATGVVVAKHPTVKKVKIGDRVVLTWLKCKGIQSKNPIYSDNLKKINSGSVSTFSSHSVVSENRVLKLPKDIPLRKGVILGCAFPTGAGMILNHINNGLYKKIAFVGLGGVGVSALLAGLNLNFSEICCFDINEKRINFLKKKIKNKKKVSYFKFEKKIQKKFDNYFDFVIETSGSTKGIESAFGILKNTGKMIFASHPHKGDKIKLDPFDFIKGKRIYGSWGGEVNYERSSKKIFKLFKSIKNIEKLFKEKTYSLAEINKAIQDLKKNRVLRPIIKL